ncbi:hypothetical protein [Pseudomonas sp. ANT_H12B]|uniref:hypothetical protein n=1 Tax=Pseudomonas sp. ANT_H12B TaxID=2597348 RepID=UPI0011ECD9AC|nr:hypothetical protein [Pseudomonas sp. ANT_H12B]KAA0978047.1 hypothetical protein FQ185_02830 [Pseudomonas sp. ANT_H12B]
MKKFLFVVLMALLMSGCASQKLTPEHRAQIKTVKVLPVKWESKQMSYMGREQAWGAALGAGLGAGIGMASGASRLGTSALSGAGLAVGLKTGDLASMSTVEAILYVMETEKIDLGELLKQNFVAELNKNSSLKVVGDDEVADAQIQLTVDRWGFSLTQGFSSVVYPVINVVAVMNRGDEQLWQQGDGVTPFTSGNDYGYTPLQYRTEPQTLRLALKGVTEIVSQPLAEGLK